MSEPPRKKQRVQPPAVKPRRTLSSLPTDCTNHVVSFLDVHSAVNLGAASRGLMDAVAESKRQLVFTSRLIDRIQRLLKPREMYQDFWTVFHQGNYSIAFASHLDPPSIVLYNHIDEDFRESAMASWMRRWREVDHRFWPIIASAGILTVRLGNSIDITMWRAKDWSDLVKGMTKYVKCGVYDGKTYVETSH